MDSTYRDTLLECLQYLTEAQEIFFSKIINVEMTGDLKDVNEAFSIGDVFQFELSHIETSKDPNVQTLTKLFKHIGETIDSIMNLNDISQDDIDEHRSHLN